VAAKIATLHSFPVNIGAAGIKFNPVAAIERNRPPPHQTFSS